MDLGTILYQVQGLFIALVIIIIIFFGYIFITRYRYQKKFDRDENGEKIWVHFWSQAGKYSNVICNVDQFRVQPPKGHELTEYFIENSSVYSGWYPREEGGILNKLTRVNVPCTAYQTNHREPIVSTDPKRWIDSKDKALVTSTMQRVAVNESFAKSAAALQSAAWRDIVGMVQFAKYAKYGLYASGIILIGILAIGVMIFSLRGEITNIVTAFFGS